MPALMTWGGVAFAVLGALVIFAGMPDRWAGLSMGSDLLHAGATLFAGGLIVAALGQVLRSLRDIADRVEDAGFGTPGRVINDELAEQTPVPLPRAAAPAVVPAAAAAKPAAPPRPTDLVSKLEAEMQAEAAKRPETRAPQTPPQAAPETPPPPRDARETRDPLSRALRDRAATPRPQRPERDAPPAPPAQSDQPRAAPRPPLTEPPAREEAPAEESVAERPAEPRRETPRWMRPRQAPEAPPVETPPIPMPETVPVRPTRGPMAAAGTVPPPRIREPHPLPQYESIPRRRREPEPPPPADEEEPGLVVRSGIIGGMAYTLYSDGSIEAELPIGTVRFGSLAELQEHVKRAGAEPDGDFKPAGDR